MEIPKMDVSTSDIVLAAALKVKGYYLEKIEKNGNKGIFVFRDVEVDVINEYDLGNSLVEPIAFNNAIKALTTATKRII